MHEADFIMVFKKNAEANKKRSTAMASNTNARKVRVKVRVRGPQGPWRSLPADLLTVERLAPNLDNASRHKCAMLAL